MITDKPFTWNIAFHSGMSAKSDLRAAVDEGVAVGVVATLLDVSKAILVLPRHLDAGGFVFIDSGAFTAFQKSEPLDWNKVFAAYETVLLHTERPSGLSIVAPDVVGDQAATIELWARHAFRVRSWIDAGARVIVPLQRGTLTAQELLQRAKQIFGCDKFCAGIPSNLQVMELQDAASLRHDQFHILGRVVLTPELKVKVQTLIENNPAATFSADANWLRSRITRICSDSNLIRCDTACWPMQSSRTRAVRALLRTESYCRSGCNPAEMVG